MYKFISPCNCLTNFSPCRPYAWVSIIYFTFSWKAKFLRFISPYWMNFCSNCYSMSSFKVLILISITKPVPNLFFICYPLPKHLNTPPFTIIPILVLRASASSILCVVKTTALDFYWAIWPTIDHIKRRDSGSIPADGSSRKIIGGFPIRASATQSLRLLPPLSVPAGLFRCMPRPKFKITYSTSFYLKTLGIPLIYT